MAPARPADLHWREEPRAEDIAAVEAIVTSTGFFNPAEIAIAMELVEERLRKGPASGYAFLFAEAAGEMLGYTCYGPVPATATTYNLYWVAVRRERQAGGLGRALLERTEQAIRHAGGRDVYLDTSARALYLPTRAFYAAAGYRLAAEFPDFYAPGDAKLVYVKRLG